MQRGFRLAYSSYLRCLRADCCKRSRLWLWGVHEHLVIAPGACLRWRVPLYGLKICRCTRWKIDALELNECGFLLLSIWPRERLRTGTDAHDRQLGPERIARIRRPRSAICKADLRSNFYRSSIIVYCLFGPWLPSSSPDLVFQAVSHHHLLTLYVGLTLSWRQRNMRTFWCQRPSLALVLVL